MIIQLATTITSPIQSPILLIATPVIAFNGTLSTKRYHKFKKEMESKGCDFSFFQKPLIHRIKQNGNFGLFYSLNGLENKKMLAIFWHNQYAKHGERLEAYITALASIEQIVKAGTAFDDDVTIAVDLANVCLGESINKQREWLDFFANSKRGYEVYSKI